MDQAVDTAVKVDAAIDSKIKISTKMKEGLQNESKADEMKKRLK
jgi:hypothetical protein